MAAERPIVALHHWSIYDLPIEEACVLAAEEGYDGLDLGTGDLGRGVRLDLAVLAGDPAEAERLAKLDRHGLAFTDLVAGVVSLPGMTQDHRRTGVENFEKLAANVSSLVPGVTLLPGFFAPQERTQAFRTTAEDLRRYVEVGARHGLEVSIEPHVDSVTDTPERTLEMLDAVPGLTLTLDYSHFVYSGIDQAAVEPLHRFTRHVHVRQAAPGRLSVEVDEGTIDFRRALLGLKEAGYRGVFTAEYVPSSWKGQDSVKDPQAENRLIHRQMVSLIEECWGGLG